MCPAPTSPSAGLPPGRRILPPEQLAAWLRSDEGPLSGAMLNSSQIMRLELNMQVLRLSASTPARFRRPCRISAEDLQMGSGHFDLPGIEDGEPDRPGHRAGRPAGLRQMAAHRPQHLRPRSRPAGHRREIPGDQRRLRRARRPEPVAEQHRLWAARRCRYRQGAEGLCRQGQHAAQRQVGGRLQSAPQRDDLHRLPPDAWHCRLPLHRRRSGQRAAPQRRLRAGLGRVLRRPAAPPRHRRGVRRRRPSGFHPRLRRPSGCRNMPRR